MLNVSVYRGPSRKRVTFVCNQTLEEVLTDFKSLKYAEITARVRRELAQEKEPSEKYLLYFTFAATFKGGRVKTNLEATNGIVVVRVPILNPDELKLVREKAITEPNTLAAFVSLDGKYMVILVRVSKPDGRISVTPSEAEEFQDHASLMVRHYYQQHLGVITHKDKHLLAQLTEATCDEELYFNPESELFLVSMKSDYERKPTQLVRDANGEPVTFALLPIGEKRDVEVKRAFDRAWLNALGRESFEENQRFEFVYALGYFCCLSGIPEGEALKFAQKRCLTSQYTKEDLVRSFRMSYQESEEFFGKNDGISKLERDTYNLERFIKQGFKLRRNVILNEIEFRYAEQENHLWDQMKEQHVNSIYIRAHKNGIPCTLNDVKVMINSEMTSDYNPFKEYIFNLGTWNGHDYIADMAATVPTRDPAFFAWGFRKWFLAYVLSLVNDQVVNHVVLMLMGGEQGQGKSTWTSLLLPPQWRKQYYDANVSISSKNNTRMKMSTCALLNIDEWDTIDRAEQEASKELFTTSSVSIRTSVERPTHNQVRHASFVGTTNHMGIISDYTGSRRYFCNEVTGPIHCDFSMDYDQLYAQAWTLIMEGNRHYFDREDCKRLEEHNQRFMETDADMELFSEYYRKPDQGEEGVFLSAAQIAASIRVHAGVNVSKKMILKLGRNLKSLHYESRKYLGITRYNVMLQHSENEEIS
ncbi:MAG: VapE family protein [Bacteroidales bacterium]|nr:VapE family protein [Bacteroidales bacterium]